MLTCLLNPKHLSSETLPVQEPSSTIVSSIGISKPLMKAPREKNIKDKVDDSFDVPPILPARYTHNKRNCL